MLSTVINLGYFGLMESTRGQTVGKMLMKLHVEGASGGKPTLEEAVKRNIWMGLPDPRASSRSSADSSAVSCSWSR